ncbi:kinase-like domain-containing protein [Cladochytrium replicatum]|nr:kinase-like domain-containing protein [Cladochytrium replicatum]
MPTLVPTLVSRLAQNEIAEPAEEIRLLMVHLMADLVGLVGSGVGPFADEYIRILLKTLVDPYPEIKKVGRRGHFKSEGERRKVKGDSCKLVGKIAEHVPKALSFAGDSVPKTLLVSLVHRHSSVRPEALQVLPATRPHTLTAATLVDLSGFDAVLETLYALTEDKGVSVREAVLRTSGTWLRECPDRYTLGHKLLPILYSRADDDDEVPKVRELCASELEKTGAQEWSERVKDEMDYDGGAGGVGVRRLARDNVMKIVEAGLKGLGDWNAEGRARWGRVLGGLFRVCAGDEVGVVKAATTVAERIGGVVWPEIGFGVCVSQLREDARDGVRVEAIGAWEEKMVHVVVGKEGGKTAVVVDGKSMAVHMDDTNFHVQESVRDALCRLVGVSPVTARIAKDHLVSVRHRHRTSVHVDRVIEAAKRRWLKDEPVPPALARKYQQVRELGQGAYGVVSSAKCLETGQEVAIKKVQKVFEKSILAKRALREIKLLKHFNGHENELMEADLHQIIRSEQPLTDAHFQYFIYQICRGLKYIHSANVLHRDLTPGNLLVSADCELKVKPFGAWDMVAVWRLLILFADLRLGLARGLTGSDAGFMTEYVVPELHQSQCVSFDVWSVGCIFAELLGGKPLFKGRDYVDNQILQILGTPDDATLRRIGSERAQLYIRSLPRMRKVPFSQLYLQAGPEALDLLERLLTFDPAERITVEEALNHPYLAAYHDEEDEPVRASLVDFAFESVELIEEMKQMIANLQDAERNSARSHAQQLHYHLQPEGAEEEACQALQRNITTTEPWTSTSAFGCARRPSDGRARRIPRTKETKNA